MVDLASYGITAQSFEFLCTLSAERLGHRAGPRPVVDAGRTNKVWTFKLRQGVTWHDGTPFTADDVVATMERLVTAGNSGLKGVIAAGFRGRDRPEHGHLHAGRRRTATSRTSCRSSTPSR